MRSRDNFKFKDINHFQAIYQALEKLIHDLREKNPGLATRLDLPFQELQRLKNDFDSLSQNDNSFVFENSKLSNFDLIPLVDILDANRHLFLERIQELHDLICLNKPIKNESSQHPDLHADLVELPLSQEMLFQIDMLQRFHDKSSDDFRIQLFDLREAIKLEYGNSIFKCNGLVFDCTSRDTLLISLLHICKGATQDNYQQLAIKDQSAYYQNPTGFESPIGESSIDEEFSTQLATLSSYTDAQRQTDDFIQAVITFVKFILSKQELLKDKLSQYNIHDVNAKNILVALSQFLNTPILQNDILTNHFNISSEPILKKPKLENQFKDKLSLADKPKAKELSHAIKKNDIKRVSELLNQTSALVNALGDDKLLPLETALIASIQYPKNDYMPLIKLLIETYKAPLNQINAESGNPILHTLLYEADNNTNTSWLESVISCVIDKDADINAKDKTKRNLIHLALVRNIPIVLFLQRSGCDINAKDIAGKTPLDYALEKYSATHPVIEQMQALGAKKSQELDALILNREEFVPGKTDSNKSLNGLVKEMLGQYGADKDPICFWIKGINTLDKSYYQDELTNLKTEIEKLVATGQSLNKSLKNHKTYLQLAIEEQQPEKLAVLLECGANPFFQNDKGKTAYEILLQPNYFQKPIFDELLKHTKDFDFKFDQDKTFIDLLHDYIDRSPGAENFFINHPELQDKKCRGVLIVDQLKQKISAKFLSKKSLVVNADSGRLMQRLKMFENLLKSAKNISNIEKNQFLKKSLNELLGAVQSGELSADELKNKIESVCKDPQTKTTLLNYANEQLTHDSLASLQLN